MSLNANVTSIFDKAVAEAGRKPEDFLCTGKAVIVALVAHKYLKGVLLPDEMDIVNSADDVQLAIDRVATDDAYSIAAVDALRRYVDSKTSGGSFDNQSTKDFYDSFKNLSEDGQHAKVLETFDKLNTTLVKELTESGVADSYFVDYPKFFEDISKQQTSVIIEAFSEAIKFVMMFGKTLCHYGDSAEDIEAARLENRSQGGLSTIMLDVQILPRLQEHLAMSLIKNLLPEGTLENLKAMVERGENPLH